MVEEIPLIHPLATIAEVEDFLLKNSRKLETINYIYVIDKDRKLKGALSVKEVFRSPKNTEVAEVMQRELVTVRPHTDEERVALLAIEHRLKEIPVVDSENRFLGVVPSDTILNVLHQESIENILKFAGVHRFKNPAKEIITAPASTYLKKRLPWLLIGLLGGLAAAAVVGFFEDTLRVELILVSFIPAIVYIADAVGTQSQTIFIRSLSLDPHFALKNYLKRELKVGVGIAVILGAGIFLIAKFLWSETIASILGISFFIAILAAIAIALFLPWCFSKFKIDPAIASGPFATVIRDIASLAIYLGIASAILQW